MIQFQTHNAHKAILGASKLLSTSPLRVGKPSQRQSFKIQAGPKQLKRQASKSFRPAKELGIADRLFDANEQLSSKISIKELLTKSLIASLTFGFAFQVTHNNGLLPVYDVWPFSVGPFLESGLVPFLLAPIWLLYGYLYPLLDEFFADRNSTKKAIERASDFKTVAGTWALAAGQFVLSDVLYLQNVPHWQIYIVMAACTALIWPLTDKSRTGIILGALLAVGAPLGEAVCVSFGLWHYERPDNPLGVCFWTAFCYATYAYGVGNFARWQTQRQIQRED